MKHNSHVRGSSLMDPRNIELAGEVVFHWISVPMSDSIPFSL